MINKIFKIYKEFLAKIKPFTVYIFAGVLVGVCILGVIIPQKIHADLENDISSATYIAKENNQSTDKIVEKIKVVITAYSSTPEETDDTPFITASGKQVADGIIANNMLPLGTKVKIPELYGDKIFVVEDRMNKRKSDYHFDIWFPTKSSALNFGVKTAELEVLES